MPMDMRVHGIPMARASTESVESVTTTRSAVGLVAPVVRTADLPGTASSVAQGRRFVDSVLDELGLDSQRYEVILMASELLTNSVLHGRGRVGLELTWLAPHLEVAVTDQGGGMGRRTAPAPFSTLGRGLRLVDQLATTCGTRSSAAGTTMWFALLMDPSSRPDAD